MTVPSSSVFEAVAPMTITVGSTMVAQPHALPQHPHHIGSTW
jgi:hypothetical protein